jgi:hypothetical protein
LSVWVHCPFNGPSLCVAPLALQNLGFSASNRKYWESKDKKGKDRNKLFDVDPGSEEYKLVSDIFLANADPASLSTYDRPKGRQQRDWGKARRIVKIQRVENGYQQEQNDIIFGAQLSHIEAVSDDVDSFPETARWVFHGTNASAMDAIVQNPVSGFTARGAGSTGTLWGAGIYFARDPQYAFDYAKVEVKSGHRAMLLCLARLGIPCVGHGELKYQPLSYRGHLFNSYIDCASNPEIFVALEGSHAYPAYKITFI